jgi:hypothetical protein
MPVGFYGVYLRAIVCFSHSGRHSPQRMEVDIRLGVFDYAYCKRSLVSMTATPSGPKVFPVDPRKQLPELMSHANYAFFLIEIQRDPEIDILLTKENVIPVSQLFALRVPLGGDKDSS